MYLYACNKMICKMPSGGMQYYSSTITLSNTVILFKEEVVIIALTGFNILTM